MGVTQRKCLMYPELKVINESSVKAGRNRNLHFENLPISDDGTIYPLAFDFVHNEREVRTQIVLNAEGLTVWLDMSFDEFENLKVFIADRIPVIAEHYSDLDTIDLDHDLGVRDQRGPFGEE